MTEQSTAAKIAKLEAQQKAAAAELRRLKREQKNAARREDRAGRAAAVQALGEAMLAMAGGDWRAVDYGGIVAEVRDALAAGDCGPEVPRASVAEARAAVDAAAAELRGLRG